MKRNNSSVGNKRRKIERQRIKSNDTQQERKTLCELDTKRMKNYFIFSFIP